MKSSTGDGADQAVLDKPSARGASAKEATKPAVDTASGESGRTAKAPKIYIDGEFFGEKDAKISVFDHGLLYGDGVFEGIRFYNGRVFRLTEHLTRLYESARSILLEMPLTFEQMEKATLETIAANGLRDGYIRLVVTRGVGPLGLNPYQCPKAGVFIIASSIALYPAEK